MKSVRYLVPNGCTALSMLFGCASAVCSSTQQFELAAWLILWGVLLDKLDGLMARLMNATSNFGVQFDSFADFIVFGIAPAALVYYRLAPQKAFKAPRQPDADWRGGLCCRDGRTPCTVQYRPCRTAIASFMAYPQRWRRYCLRHLTCQMFGLVIHRQPISAVHDWRRRDGQHLRMLKLKSRENPLIHWFQIINIVTVYGFTPFRLWPHYLSHSACCT